MYGRRVYGTAFVGPVMVWMHGGGYTLLSGSSPVNDGVRLAKKGDVVVVTLNHRLNVFGYLYLAGLPGGDKYADSGNIGQLDLIAALRWVRDNIESFGGDPRRSRSSASPVAAEGIAHCSRCRRRTGCSSARPWRAGSA